MLIPLLGFFVNLIIPRESEIWLSRASVFTMGSQFVLTLVFTIYWALIYNDTLYTRELTIYDSPSYRLFLTFVYDEITAVYLMVGALLSFLITVYSRTYLHRESGFKRFFTTIMLFYLGYNTIVLAGNFGTMFVGWEMSGLASFLLIAFYRNRYIPVKNAVKIFSVYRLGDLAFLLLLWASHHLWHGSVGLLEFENTSEVLKVIHDHLYLSIFLSIILLTIASIKSAQVPYSSWLPRAMEGPTPSSAIFYGSLAAHLGVLLLLRTYPFWSQIEMIKYIVIFSGLFTFIISTITARVQPSIKGQIAYSSIAQIGLMFIEVALGLKWLVLVHFAGNAFLRSYQILLSPSIVTYLIREQFYNYDPKPIVKSSFDFIKNSVYLISLKEWYMDEIMYHSIWNIIKRIGKMFHYIPHKLLLGIILLSTLILSCLSLLSIFEGSASYYISSIIAILGLIASLWAFTEKKELFWSWYFIGLNHMLSVLAIVLCFQPELRDIMVYVTSVLCTILLGAVILKKLKKIEVNINLKGYQGHSYEHPRFDLLFLLATVALYGFPISGIFLGVELMYGYLDYSHIILLATISLSSLVNSLASIRIYTRIFLGPHVKTYHEAARKSS